MSGRTTGLVLGKFYPPHLGHQLLIDAASASVDDLYVLVVASDNESLGLEERVRWIAKMSTHPTTIVMGCTDNTPTDYNDASIWDAHVAIFRQALGEVAERLDLVFSSEEYGAELARRLGAGHVMVDSARTGVPISATLIRGDLYKYWEYMPSGVTSGLTTRIVVLGAESSGTSTLARSLAEHYSTGALPRTLVVREYGREYTALKLAKANARRALSGGCPLGAEYLDWEALDFLTVAREQNWREQQASSVSGPLLLCDTDALTTRVFQEFYTGGVTPEVADLDTQRHDLYILTSHEGVAFEDDGLRNEARSREEMTALFRATLEEKGYPYITVTGDRQARLAQALGAIDEVLISRRSFNAPL
jgi:HTH-type transcriptional repressor of NAD biosynthesis genes